MRHHVTPGPLGLFCPTPGAWLYTWSRALAVDLSQEYFIFLDNPLCFKPEASHSAYVVLS